MSPVGCTEIPCVHPQMETPSWACMHVGRKILDRFNQDRILKRRLPAEFRACPILVSPGSGFDFESRELNRIYFRLLRVCAP
jgi:hypothetical protein